MKVGFNCSSCDLFHAGHVTMMKMEKEMCDYLKVALQVDPTIDRPGIKTNQFNQYMKGMSNFKDVNMLMRFLVYETEADLLNLIQTQTIDI